MGRGKGVHAVFGTQGIADLCAVNNNFKSQMLDCANTIICHRLNDQESAEAVAGWMGTKDTFNITSQYDGSSSGASLGSVRRIKPMSFILNLLSRDWLRMKLMLLARSEDLAGIE